MVQLLDSWLKSAVLEIQEYVRLQFHTVRGVFSRPFYFRDVVEQFEEIGVGSLTVVLLTGFFTGAVLALQTGITLDQFGARPFVGRCCGLLFEPTVRFYLTVSVSVCQLK